MSTAPNPLIALDFIGVKEATDKSSLGGDYLRHYESGLSHIRDDEFNLIEIGVFRGNSVRTWAQFFSRAHIVGVDINPACLTSASDRISIEIGSQNDPAFLHRLISQYPPRVIIDDGSHQSYDVIFTFERLFPTLEPGGIYIIEDLHFHHTEHEAERLRGGSPVLAHDYVAGLVRDRLGSTAYVSRLAGIRRYIVGSIDRIEIFSQAALIRKKAKLDLLGILQAARPYVEQSNDWLNWINFAQKLLEARGGDDAVIDALRNALKANPNPIVTYHRLSEALERTGNTGSAIETLERALVVAKDNPKVAAELRDRLKRLRSVQT